MKLFSIDKPDCNHIIDIMPSIKAIYQLEVEFQPYLQIEFIPNNGEKKAGIVLRVNNELIYRPYTFDDPMDMMHTRRLIWHYLQKNNHISNLVRQDQDGYIKDFRNTQTNKVIMGWSNKLCDFKQNNKEIKYDPLIRSPLFNGTHFTSSDIQEHDIKHWVYKDNTKNLHNVNACKKIRLGECADNHVIGSHQYQMCADKVNWVCKRTYPINKLSNETIKYRESVKKFILDQLKKSGGKVNKSLLDTILFSGLFENPQKLGTTYDAINYDKNVIEGFGKKINLINIIVVIIIIIALLLYYLG